MPETTSTGVARLEARKLIDNLMWNDNTHSPVDLMLAALPQPLQQSDEAQPIIRGMRGAGERYLPLRQELRRSDLFGDLPRILPRLAGILFVVGLIACLSLAAGVIVALLVLALFLVYLSMRWQITQEIRAELYQIRDELVKYRLQLGTLETRLIEQERAK